VALVQREYARLKEEVELHERLAKATADLARLSSDLSKEAAHSIPGIPISLPDSLILSLFPLGVFRPEKLCERGWLVWWESPARASRQRPLTGTVSV
jgi:hypothetical protein